MDNLNEYCLEFINNYLSQEDALNFLQVIDKKLRLCQNKFQIIEISKNIKSK
jgi:hypothetical protein